MEKCPPAARIDPPLPKRAPGRTPAQTIPGSSPGPPNHVE